MSDSRAITLSPAAGVVSIQTTIAEAVTTAGSVFDVAIIAVEDEMQASIPDQIALSVGFADLTMTPDGVYNIMFSGGGSEEQFDIPVTYYSPSLQQMSRADITAFSSGPPSSQHYRIFVHDNNGDANHSIILEVELASTAGGVDFTTPGMTTDESSFHSGSTTGASTIDNNLAQGWTTFSGSPYPSWVTIDVGSVQEISELRIYGPTSLTGDPYNRTIKDFDFDISDDGIIWSTIASFTGVSESDWIINEYNRFDVSGQPTAPPPYSQFRITCTANNGHAQFVGIQEIELASTPAGADFTAPGMVTNQSSDQSRAAFNAIANTFSGTSDCWLSEDGLPMPQFMSVDTGAPNVLSELRIMPTDDSFGWLAGGNAPMDFDVEGSHNGTDWVIIKSFAGITSWVDGVAKVFDMT